MAPGAPAHAQQPGCIGEVDADAFPQKPGERLRFGITPGVTTGQFFTGPVEPRVRLVRRVLRLTAPATRSRRRQTRPGADPCPASAPGRGARGNRRICAARPFAVA